MTDSVFSVTRFTAALLTVVMIIGTLPMVMSDNPIVDNASAEGGYVNVGWIGEFMNWNPLKADFVSDWVAYNLIFSTLFQYDENWSEIKGHLAKDYYQVEWPAGNMSTYINITDNAYFRNGDEPNDMTEPLTAEDIKFTFDLIQANPGNTWDYYLYNVSGTYALSDYQVQIDTDYPKATLIDDLVWVPILPEHQWSQITGGAVLGHWNPEDLIGSGPFYYDDGSRNDWHRFNTAPNFHATADYGEDRDIDYDGIVFQIFTDTVPLIMAINSGDLDVVDVTGAQESAWESLGSTGQPIIKQVTQELGVYDIAINAIPLEIRDAIGYADSGNLILMDPIVRQAIGMTMNRSGIVEEFWGLAEPADTVLNPGYWHANLSNPLPFDPAAAKDLLISAGYEENENGYLEVTTDSLAYTEYGVEEGTELEFRLHVPDTDPGYATIGMTWVSWAADAGIKFDYEALPSGVMTNEEWYKCEYDLWVWSWYWGPEPLSNLACWLSEQIRLGGYNCVGPICQGGFEEPDGWWWADEENDIVRCGFDEDFEDALRATNKSERRDLVHKLQEDIYNTYTEFPPIHPVGLYAMSTARFDGWGNWTESVARTIISDMLWIWYDLEPVSSNEYPVFEVTPPSDMTVEVGDDVTFSIVVSDPESDEITVNWSSISVDDQQVIDSHQNVIDGDTTVGTTVEWVTTYDTAGDYLLRVGLSDPEHEFENVETCDVSVVTELNTVPHVEGLIVTPERGYIDEVTTWSIWASDTEQGPEGEGLTFTWDWGDGTSNTTKYQPVNNDTLIQDEQTHSWAEDDEYLVTVTVWDGYADSPDHNVTVLRWYTVYENMPPTAASATNISGLAGQMTTCEAVSSDSDADDLRFTWDWDDGTSNVTDHATSANPGEEVTSSVKHVWTSAGTYSVEIWVDDGSGHNVSTNITANILAAGEEAPPGSITIKQSPNPATVDIPVVLTVGATDPNEDALTVTIDFGDGSELAVDESAGGTLDAQYVEFSHVYSAGGTFAVIAYVDDGTDNVSATKNVLVELNKPPEVLMASAYSAYYNKSFSIRPVSVSDPDGDVMTAWYDWGDDSPGTIGDPDDGFLASHTYNKTGSFELTIYVDDNRGHNVSVTAALEVLEGNWRPTLVGATKSDPAGDRFVPGETVYINVTVRDKEGDNLTITVDFGDDTDPAIVNLDADPNINETVTFTHAYEEGRDDQYVVTISLVDDKDHSDNSPITMEVRVSVQKEDDGGIGSALLIALALIAILALVAAFFLMKRKGKGAKPSDIGDMEGMDPSEETEGPQEGIQEPQPADQDLPPP